MTRYRSARAVFSQEEYEAQRDLFYRLPARWGQPGGGSPLARLRDLGGLAAVSVLPILGQYAAARFAGDVAMPKEKLARLAGVDPGSLAKAARGLEELGLARARIGRFHGVRLTKWAVFPAIATTPRPVGSSPSEGPADDAFYFMSSVIYGGNWRRLSGPQHAIYMAAATRARTYRQHPLEIEDLRWSVPREVPRNDLVASYDFRGQAWVRLAEVSYRELQEITGLSLSTVKSAVRGLKHPCVWPGVMNDSAALRYAPLSVYPTSGGSLIYHFRDHADHWPWDPTQATHPEASRVPPDDHPSEWLGYED